MWITENKGWCDPHARPIIVLCALLAIHSERAVFWYYVKSDLLSIRHSQDFLEDFSLRIYFVFLCWLWISVELSIFQWTEWTKMIEYTGHHLEVMPVTVHTAEMTVYFSQTRRCPPPSSRHISFICKSFLSQIGCHSVLIYKALKSGHLSRI